MTTGKRLLNGWTRRLLPLLTLPVLAACEDRVPTAVDPALAPVDPVTFEVILPWSQFASDARVWGGFGRPVQTGTGLVAHEYDGLEARTLARFERFPLVINVPDSLGTARNDTLPSFFGGAVLVTFDTTSNPGSSPVGIAVERIQKDFDTRTASWELAVDSGGVQVPWGEPGGGPAVTLNTATWTPGTGSQVLIPLDSVEVAALGDTTSSERGVRLRMTSPGHRLDVTNIQLQLNTRPSINQDTTVFIFVDAADLTYVYTPRPPDPGPGELRVGGVPGWRTVMTLGLPAVAPTDPTVCARVACPISLTADRVNHAALLLTTRASPTAYAPSDTFEVEVRGVLAPDLLPKSPVTGPLFLDSLGLSAGIEVREQAFQPGGARVVEIPITPIIRSLLSGESIGGFRPTPTVALLEVPEPSSFPFASFVGPGMVGEPRLRLVVTVSDAVALP